MSARFALLVCPLLLSFGCSERKVIYITQSDGTTAPAATAAPVVSDLIPDPPQEPASPAPIPSSVAVVTTDVAGTGVPGLIGDGGSAVAAQLSTPGDVALDLAGNLYVADTGNSVVRRIDAVTGEITTVAGDGTFGFGGDGGLATEAQLKGPTGISLDDAGNLYIADALDHRIRRVDPAGVITTLAGDGLPGFGGDQGPATAAQLNGPYRVETTPMADRIFIVDRGNHRIRKIQDGMMITVVGAGEPGGAGAFGGDGGLGGDALLNSPSGVTFDDELNLYIADTGNHRVRRLDWTTFVMTTVAGTGAPGFTGDGDLANLAQLTTPCDVFLDRLNDRLYVTDAGNLRVRAVTNLSNPDPATQLISTVAGDGFPAPALTVPDLPRFSAPDGLAVEPSSRSFVVADRDDHRIRRTTLP